MSFITIGQRIWEKRKALRLSQSELGEMTDVDGNTISRWERDVIGIRIKNLVKLAKALDCSVNHLLKDPKESTDQEDTDDNECTPERGDVKTDIDTIVIETKEGEIVTRYGLPATSESYDFLKQLHKETGKLIMDNEDISILRMIKSVSEERKREILDFIYSGESKA